MTQLTHDSACPGPSTTSIGNVTFGPSIDKAGRTVAFGTHNTLGQSSRAYPRGPDVRGHHSLRRTRGGVPAPAALSRRLRASDAPVLSAAGRQVAYYSAASGHVFAMVGDVRRGTATNVCQPIVNTGNSTALLVYASGWNRLAISRNARRLLFTGVFFELVLGFPDNNFNVS